MEEKKKEKIYCFLKRGLKNKDQISNMSKNIVHFTYVFKVLRILFVHVKVFFCKLLTKFHRGLRKNFHTCELSFNISLHIVITLFDTMKKIRSHVTIFCVCNISTLTFEDFQDSVWYITLIYSSTVASFTSACSA